MTPAQLSDIVLRTVRQLVEADELRVRVPERVVVQAPPRPGAGDYATNVALRLAQESPSGAREIAEVLRRRLVGADGVARVDVAGPGFLNITLDAACHGRLVRAILDQGAGYGWVCAVSGTPGGPARVPGEGDSAAVFLRSASGSEGEDAEPRAALVREVLARLSRVRGHAPRRPPLLRPAGMTGEGLLRLLGPDAARWALLGTPLAEPPRLDPGALLAQRETNPLFRVRYAHARTRALLRNARDLGVPEEPEAAYGYPHPAETGLLTLLGDVPRVLDAAALRSAPDRLARHLEAVADAFFRFHDTCLLLPRGEQKPLAAHRSRLALAEAAGTVLGSGLRLLGIEAPDHL
ncbi:DALR anticodon-binding domain-containing protein [Streptomyces sp. B1866]|uniref:ArgS-related anticodon-binding protein NrtL n=1 Tax=Streptomyces sp. B1866 TaxID=3075431 RepID=UPI00288F9FF8|nr:DALR anticodon-binding domain-containing protein [Streptomyces sp. B1866]MDT3395775.1 DALR anticodon-binding domain-containing protein [Streptomyces sp. B1866]